MDDDDFRALIAVLEQELRGAGATDIADPRHYLRPGIEGGEARLLNPQERLVEMLAAFERKLAMEDRATYHKALARMNEALDSDGPQGAVFELVREQERTPIVVDLGDAPELGELRDEIGLLITRLLESRFSPRDPA
ncbi:MAG: hypothetical protein P4L66_15900 [Acetobacteraceae bacterium]|nr:hypothetical protein [Acetobacteraceae bacterium]